jgi:hypothetical protein
MPRKLIPPEPWWPECTLDSLGLHCEVCCRHRPRRGVIQGMLEHGFE